MSGNLLNEALRLAASGLSLIPVNLATKRPRLEKWKHFRQTPATPSELGRWFANAPDGVGLAIITGSVKDFDIDLKVLPLDERADFVEKLNRTFEEFGADSIANKCPIYQTKNGGLAMLWRSQTDLRNVKLASIAGVDTDGKTEPKALIETRGHGGYCVAPPSEGYRMHRGNLCELPELTQDEENLILNAARSLNEYVKIVEPPKTHTATASKGAATLKNDGLTPWQDYDARGADEVPSLLRAAGWQSLKSDETYWQRPNKQGGGNSATWGTRRGDTGTPLFYVFSSNAHPFESERAYSPSAVYTLLNCGADFSEAARQLRAKGYGAPPERKTPKAATEGALQERIERNETAHYESEIVEEGKPKTDFDSLESRRFNPDLKLERPEPVLSLAGVPVCTRGNLSAIVGRAGVAKSRFLAAALARLLSDKEGDFLHWQGGNIEGQAVSYFDCEQSPYDFYSLMKGVLWRGGVDTCPDWFGAYRVAGVPPVQILALIQTWLEYEHEKRGVRLLVIDGFADLVASVNDERECNALIALLMDYAARFDCAILGVIHLNQGGNENARGHLGKGIERKAGMCVELKRDAEGVIQISTPVKARNAPLGTLAIAWDEKRGDFACTASKVQKRINANEERKKQAAGDLFKVAGKATLTHSEAVQTLQELTGTGADNCKKKLAAYRAANYLKVDSQGGYYLAITDEV
jgi:hypothetical protein